MVFIRLRRGLDLPLNLETPKKATRIEAGPLVGTDFSPFASLPLKVLVTEGEEIHIGTPLVVERGGAKRKILSTCRGIVKEIRRGLRRQPLCLIAERLKGDPSDSELKLSPIDVDAATKELIVQRISDMGLFASISQRPFDIPANPHFLPQSIFIKAIDKAPGAIGYESQVEQNEDLFTIGLKALWKITPGAVHLIADESSSFAPFRKSENSHCHSVEGPYPACHPSLHIAHIAPIQSIDNLIWTLDATTVLAVGKAIHEGRAYLDQEIAYYGGENSRRIICPRGTVIQDILEEQNGMRIICGSPLTGIEKTASDPLPSFAQTLFLLPEDHERTLLHFMRIQSKSYTATRTFKKPKQPLFSTNQNGEGRPFIDGAIYDRLMPLGIPVMPLIKAVISGDFERAKELGLLEVAGEDFALPAFICPSKIEMVDIISSGLKLYAKQLL